MAILSKIHISLIALVLLHSLQLHAHTEAEIEALTGDGRRVLLREDHTWSFIKTESGDPSTSAVLTLVKMEEMQDACRFQFRLENNLGYKITHLVPRLSIYNESGVRYETKSISFANIKPTKTKYTKVQFNGIGCYQMTRVKLHDAGRCRMGEIDMWNEEEGQCLSLIYMTPSDLINISK